MARNVEFVSGNEIGTRGRHILKQVPSLKFQMATPNFSDIKMLSTFKNANISTFVSFFAEFGCL